MSRMGRMALQRIQADHIASPSLMTIAQADA
jgi:hypothetical protein